MRTISKFFVQHVISRDFPGSQAVLWRHVAEVNQDTDGMRMNFEQRRALSIRIVALLANFRSSGLP
jgi:hypothetical protein